MDIPILSNLSESQPKRIDFTPEGITRTDTFHGDFSIAEDDASHLQERIGVFDSEFGGIISSVSVQRMNAMRAQLEVASREIKNVSWWGLSFVEISKPIKTWLKLKMDQGGGETAEPELQKIQLWEQLRDREDPKWLEYKYDAEGNALEGNTLALAKKIVQGVDSYSIYAPVLTCTMTSMMPFTTGLENIGKYRTKIDYDPEFPPKSTEQFGAFAALAIPYWFMQMDNIACNTDGTFTRSQQWQGLTWIDTDLYESI